MIFELTIIDFNPFVKILGAKKRCQIYYVKNVGDLRTVFTLHKVLVLPLRFICSKENNAE
jgi:hypothetical protein